MTCDWPAISTPTHPKDALVAIPEDQIEVPQARRQIQKSHSNYGQVLQTPKDLRGGVDPKPFRQVVLDWKAQREVSQYDNATGDANQV